MRLAKFTPRPLLALPLSQAEGNKLLRWIVAIMVYVLSLAICVIIGATHMTGRWDSALNNQLTIEVAANSDDQTEPLAARVAKVKTILDQYTAVMEVKDLPEQELRDLLTPWLGETALLSDIPLPALIEVTFAPGKDVDISGLAKQLSEKVAGVNVAVHNDWAQDIKRLAMLITLVAYALLGLVSLAAVACITFAARARLAIHSAEVEMLHILGATDRYVARQFQRQAFVTTLQGVLLGLVLIALTLAIALFIMHPANIGAVQALFDTVHLSAQEVWLVIGVPVGIILAAVLAARWAVLGALRKLP